MQPLGQVATDIDTEYYSLGESIWHLLLMIKLWLKHVKAWYHIFHNIHQSRLLFIVYYTWDAH